MSAEYIDLSISYDSASDEYDMKNIDPTEFMTDEERKEFFYPEPTMDGVVQIDFQKGDIIVRFCKELAHAISFNTLNDYVFEKCTSLFLVGDPNSHNPIDWDVQRIMKCPCYDLDGKECGETYSEKYILDQLPQAEQNLISKRINDKLNRELREHFLKVRPGGIDCVSFKCKSEGVYGIGYPIPSSLRRYREFEDNDVDNIYQCITCGITWCNQCKCQYFTYTLPEKLQALSHDAHSCHIMERLKNGLDPSVELINKMTQPCPHCGIKINIYEGCNRVTCTSCRNSFCWRCGEKIEDGSKDAVYKHIKSVHGRSNLYNRPQEIGIMR